MVWARIGVVGMLVLALLGPAGHVLEVPGKWSLPPDVWLLVQQRLYPGFAVVGAFGYLGAPLACLAFAYGRRGSGEAHVARLSALLVLAALMVWTVVVAPVNGLIAAAQPGTLPDHWPEWRRRWQSGHAASALLVATALGLQLHAAMSAIAHPSERRRAARPATQP